jgi:hypothetical protein
MDLEILQSLACLGVPLFLGSGLLASLGIGIGTDRISYLAWAWVAGCVLAGFILAGWLACSPHPLSPAWPAGLMLGCGVLLWAISRRPSTRSRALNAQPEDNGTSKWELRFFQAALAFVLFATFERILFGSLHSIVTTDEAAFWSFRAKVLFHEGGFGEGYAAGIRQTQQGNADYPLLNPLLQLWSFVTSGQITHLANRLIIVMFCPALALALAGALRRLLRPGIAGLLLLLLANMQPFLSASVVAYSDVMVALGAVVVLDSALRWNAERKAAWLWLGSLGLCLCLASKNDGILVALALAGALALTHVKLLKNIAGVRQIFGFLPYALFPLVTYLLGKLHNNVFQFNNLFFGEARTQAAKQTYSVTEGSAPSFGSEFMERLGPIAEFFSKEIFFNPQHSAFVLPAFILFALALLFKGKQSMLRFTALFVGLQLAGIILVFFFLPFEIDYHLKTAASRVSIVTLPLAMLAMAAGAGMFPGIAQKPCAWAQLTSKRWSFAIVIYLLGAAGLSTAASVERIWKHREASFDKAIDWSQERRLENAFSREAARYGLEPKELDAIYASILQHVPEDGKLIAKLPLGGRLKIPFLMRIMTYPRQFRILNASVGEQLKDHQIGPLVGQVWVLDLNGLDAELGRFFECVDRGSTWSLWH